MFKKRLPIVSFIITLVAALFSVYTLQNKLSVAEWLGITLSFFGVGISLGSLIFKNKLISK
ncbi:MAG: hypothetical protein JXA68_01865 [Ignavibacteriales bacterium]|nr:hypothetical protein [Ignavibacteriales bacterium]